MLFVVGTFSGMLSTILLHRASALRENMCLAALSGQRQLYRSTSFILEFSSFRSYAFQPTGLETLLSIPVVKKKTALAVFCRQKENCTCSFLSSILVFVIFARENACLESSKRKLQLKTALTVVCRQFLSSISVVNFCRQFLSSILVVKFSRHMLSPNVVVNLSRQFFVWVILGFLGLIAVVRYVLTSIQVPNSNFRPTASEQTLNKHTPNKRSLESYRWGNLAKCIAFI